MVFDDGGRRAVRNQPRVRDGNALPDHSAYFHVHLDLEPQTSQCEDECLWSLQHYVGTLPMVSHLSVHAHGGFARAEPHGLLCGAPLLVSQRVPSCHAGELTTVTKPLNH